MKEFKDVCEYCSAKVIVREINKTEMRYYNQGKKDRHKCNGRNRTVSVEKRQNILSGNYEIPQKPTANPKRIKLEKKITTKSTDKVDENGKSYRQCGYCDSLFFWHKSSDGRWVPVEEDGNIHQCRSKIPTCRNCGRDIQFIKNVSGKWQPFEIDGRAHNCANFISK